MYFIYSLKDIKIDAEANPMGPMRTLSSTIVCTLFLMSGCGSDRQTSLQEKIASPFASENDSGRTPAAPQQPLPPMTPTTPQPPLASGGLPQSGFNAGLPTLYVVVSGNATCNPIHYRDRLPGLIKTGLYSGFIHAMMDSKSVGETDNIIFACYERLSPKMQVYDLRNRPEMIDIDHSQLDSIVIPQAQLYSRVVMIGHSYGGWRSMKLASSPQFQQVKRGATTLITIDPISKSNCTNPLDADCRKAPADFNRAELVSLNSGTRWLNAVQEPGIVIGSDSMAAAHINLKFNGANHFSIASDDRVWAAINEFIRQ